MHPVNCYCSDSLKEEQLAAFDMDCAGSEIVDRHPESPNAAMTLDSNKD